ncbi:HlyD family secretion protein [Roseixanthobacter glucoisosaccharinicivorans]|uniref:HlyD family secretion protein n=1 Tax=Roseixanthobacter glucoisosaccharinicivorans TaxID=3119923 RepID=UPI00372D2DD6
MDLKVSRRLEDRPADRPDGSKSTPTVVSEAPAEPNSDTAKAPADKPKKSRVKRLVLGIAVVGLLAGGAWYGWDYWTVGRFEVSTDDAYVKADSTIVAPKVSGYLREVLVADNQPVTAGAVLAKIDDRDYIVALHQADSNVAAAAAVVDTAKATLEQQAAVVDQARAAVTLDQANLTFAEQENDRYATLAKSGSGSVQNAQQAVSKLSIARATLERDAAALAAAQKQIATLKAQIAKAEADLTHAESLREQANLNLSYSEIVAPIDGIVGNRTLRVGQFVQAGTALMSVVPLSSVYIVANYKETQLTDVRPGQPVEIEVDSFPGHTLRGTVDSIAPASGQEFALLPPDNATGNFTKIVQRVPVRINVAADNALAGLMRPGMSVTPTIETKEAAQRPSQ